ncbi:MAG: hypothetical protein ACMUJM_14705 [bacterium]
MKKKFFKKSLHQLLLLLSVFFIGVLVFISSGDSYIVYAQLPGGEAFGLSLNPLYYGMPYLSGNPIFHPAIRVPTFGGIWPGANWSRGGPRLAMPAPTPVIRHAAITITVLINNGPTSALLVYNPTILFGVSAPTIIPTALTSTSLTLPALFSGKPLIFGSVPITASNLQILNFVANNFLLPSGIAFYILP